MTMIIDKKNYTTVILEEVNSTNAYALANCDLYEDKTVVYTAKQTDGRGRYTRKWISDGSENLYMSVVLKPTNIDKYPYQNLTQYLSVILCRFLKDEYGIESAIKWPNDILVNGAKISGILAEVHSANNKADAIVLGLGLNVNMGEETIKTIDQKATSIKLLKGGAYNIDIIAEKICDDFFKEYDDFVKKGFKYIKDEYISKCKFLGKRITIREFDEKREYDAIGIDDDGLLTVKKEDNNICKIITGDVLC